jgi:CelD/BcsL family acetyltransferase involved in cellulose biosynthesis
MSLFTSAQIAGSIAAQPMVQLVRRVGLDDVRVRLMSVAELVDEVRPWQQLSNAALEPNVFYDPPFALASMLHIAEGPLPRVLLVERLTSTGFVWIGFFPHGYQRLNGGPRLIRGLRNRQMALGTPLVHREYAETAIACWLDWLETEASSSIAMLPMLRLDGPFAALLRQTLEQRSLPVRLYGTHQRAMLPGRQKADLFFETHWRAKKLKELRRLRRRLEEHGPVHFEVYSKGEDLRRRTEDFLILEAAGWKGQRATGLVQEPGRAAFARATLRGLQKQGRLTIAALKAGETIVAIGLILRHGDRAFFWKLAFDERFAAFSPGVQFVQELTRLVLEDASLAAIDSCAIADHPMIDHLWRDRQAVGDVMINARAGWFRWWFASQQEMLARWTRAQLKHCWHKIQGDSR